MKPSPADSRLDDSHGVTGTRLGGHSQWSIAPNVPPMPPRANAVTVRGLADALGALAQHVRPAAPGGTMSVARLYDELASWWPLLSSPADYAEEAAFYRRALLEACARPAETRMASTAVLVVCPSALV